MKIVGLTGGISSGKSTVSNMIKENKIPIIDADKIARELVEPNSGVLKDIQREFGDEIVNPDGTLDRKKLGNIVFNNKARLEALNNITHPVIKKSICTRLSEYKSEGKRLCIVDAAILIEANFTDLVDYIILIYVDVNIQKLRLMTRDNLTEGEALKRIESQMNFEEKKNYSDFIIDNSKDLEYTREQLNKILNEILSLEDTDV